MCCDAHATQVIRRSYECPGCDRIIHFGGVRQHELRLLARERRVDPAHDLDHLRGAEMGVWPEKPSA